MGYHFYSEYQARLERERIARETALKVVAEKEKKAAEELRRLQEKEKEQARKLAELERQQAGLPPLDGAQPVGPAKPVPPSARNVAPTRQPALVNQGPLPGEPVPPIIPAAEKFIAEARLTSTSLDTAPYAVINRLTYRVGDRLQIAPGMQLTILSIDDGFVIFSGGIYKFKMRLTALTK